MRKDALEMIYACFNSIELCRETKNEPGLWQCPFSGLLNLGGQGIFVKYRWGEEVL